jgi:hypothetical protein
MSSALQDLANKVEPFLAGTDTAAIHDDTAGEITAITLKAAPAIDDVFLLEDASANAKKSATLGAMLKAPGWMDAATGATPLAADTLVFGDASDSGNVKKTTIGALPIAQAQVSSVLLTPAADAAVALLNTTRGVQLTVSAAGNVAISTSSSYAGQVINLFAVAVSGGGSYTLALNSGTLTLNAAGESAVVMRDSGNAAWYCVGLSGATIV